MSQRLNIFISSPGDVAAERRRASLVIEKLAKDYVRFFDIRPYLWETEPMLASGHFQDAILPPGETDIVVLILWSRLGTPLPADKYQGIDGRAPVTGTEWEFEEALAAHRARGAPDILSYKKKTPPQAQYSSEADLEGLRLQLRNLDAFWGRHFIDQGEFRAAFREFDDLDGFETKLETDLRTLIERRIAPGLAEGIAATPSPTWLKGSPFRGLAAYAVEHAAIFFGRTEATKAAVEQLTENADTGRPFLLVLGASGSGKSSLAQAGVVPALGVRGVVAGVGEWRHAIVRPAGHPSGPFMALAIGLTDDNALPELRDGQDRTALARHLEAAAADPSYPLVAALTARERAGQQANTLLSFEQVRLVLLIDQLEELFTLGDITAEQRQAFVRCLKGLMDSGRVWVLATMRSDYWHRAAETPLLVSLAEGRGRLDLLPPAQAEITEMIRRPAEAAGLAFETDARTDIRLDAALAEEAAREPGALPLMSFLLDALYAADVQEAKGATLRYASMHALGGLRGAIATRAEATFAALPADAQSALPRVLRALVTVSRSGAEPTARPVPMARFADGSAERRLVDAFVDPQVRLLVADGDGQGARVRLAHEALMTHWDRAKRQIAQDRDDLRSRAVIEEAFSEWHAAPASRKRAYLLRDPYLANAIDLAARWRDEFDRETLDFIQASERRARLRQRLVMAAAAVLALTTVAAAVFGLWAEHAQQVADTQRNQALMTQSRFLADLAEQRRDSGDAGTALLLALEALPDDTAAVARPFVPEAEFQLDEASRALREELAITGHNRIVTSVAYSPDGTQILTGSIDTIAALWDASSGKLIRTFSGHTGTVTSVAFSKDGKRIVTGSDDRTARLWDAETGALIVQFDGHESSVGSAAISPDGTRVVTASLDHTARLWDAQSGKLLITLTGHSNFVFSAAFSPDGKRVVTGSADRTARVWDADTGEQVLEMPHDEFVQSVTFGPDGTQIASASGDTAQLWDAGGGKRIRIFRGHTAVVYSVAFSTDGARLVTDSSDKAVRVWDVNSGASLFVLRGGNSFLPGKAAFSPDGSHVVAAVDFTARVWNIAKQIQSRELVGHVSDVVDAEFSPDSKRVVTGSADQTARVWDVASGTTIAVLRGHNSGVASAAFSPDGARIVTGAGDGTARVWDATTGQQILTLAAQSGGVTDAKFSPDGKVILTAGPKNGAIAFWDSTTGKGLGSIDIGSGVWTAEFSPDGSRIVTADADSTAYVLKAETGEDIAVLKGHGGAVLNAQFSPDGKRIVTASSDQLAAIWDATTGNVLLALKGHQQAVFRAQFSPDGKQIVTASYDKSAKLWNAETGALVRTIVGHRERVQSVAFSPDGTFIVTGSLDKTARLWQVNADHVALIAHARAAVPRCLNRRDRDDAFLDPEPPAWCVEMAKYPYENQVWKDWLRYRRAGANPPLPDSPEWDAWRASH